MALSLLVFPGCGTLSYLLQAGTGQLSLISHARPIPDVIKDEKTPPRIKGLLAEIPAIKKFGEQNGLKPTTNYTDYVKLDRKAAVWVVSACQPLQFKAKDWKFPIVGSFPYLGWFDRNSAQTYAAELRKEGWDVDVRGAGAFSTLGWFRDAVLSTMIPDGPEAFGDLVNVVLHESVHATLYINGQSYFNESLASFVADQLTPIYLGQNPRGDSSQKDAYLKSEELGRQRGQKLHDAYIQLDALYQSSQSEDEKTKAKTYILNELKTALQIKRDINNATLIQYKTYNSGRQDFDGLYDQCGKSVPRLLSALKTLTSASFAKAQEDEFKVVIEGLTRRGCP